MNLKTKEHEALHLPEKERAELVRKLVLSLDKPSDSERQDDWLDEAQQRASDLDCGKVEAISSEEVLSKARALLK